MAVRATRGKGFADALSREIETAVSKVIAGGKLPTSKDVKKLTASLKALNKVLKKMSAGTTGPKAAPAAPGAKRKGRKAVAVSCSVEGCSRPHYAKGMCSSHYTMELRRRKQAAQKALEKPVKKAGKRGPGRKGKPGRKPKAKVVKTKPASKRASKTCSAAGCTNPHYAKGLCKKHYMAKQYAEKK